MFHFSTSEERLFALTCAGMFVFGITLSLPGTVVGLPDAAAQFGLSLADRGTLIASLFVGLLAGSVFSGPVVDRLGQRAALAASLAFMAICLPLLALAGSLFTAGAALAGLGLSAASLNTAANALASDLFPQERGRRMNVIALVVGAGGLTMPTLTALVSGVVSWRVIVSGAGTIAALVAVALFAMRLVTTPARRQEGIAAAFLHFARQPRFGWFCVAVMLAGAQEASMAGWTSTYLGTEGFGATATWLLSSHWLGLVTGRLIFSGRVDRHKAAAIIRGALAGAACIALFVGARDHRLLAVMPFVIGVAISIVMPTILALAGERYAGNTGTLFGILLTLAQVGGIAVPSAIGLIAERAGVRGGLSLLILNAVLIAFVVGRGRKAR